MTYRALSRSLRSFMLISTNRANPYFFFSCHNRIFLSVIYKYSFLLQLVQILKDKAESQTASRDVIRMNLSFMSQNRVPDYSQP